MTEADELLSVAKAARVLGVSVKTVHRYADAGKLPVRRTAGGHRRFRLGDLLELREGRK